MLIASKGPSFDLVPKCVGLTLISSRIGRGMWQRSPTKCLPGPIRAQHAPKTWPATRTCLRARAPSWLDIWPRLELNMGHGRQLPEPLISPPTRLKEKTFLVHSEPAVNSDPSKCSPLLAGCDLQAKIRAGLHFLEPLSAQRHAKSIPAEVPHESPQSIFNGGIDYEVTDIWQPA